MDSSDPLGRDAVGHGARNRDRARDGLLMGSVLVLADSLRPEYHEIDACALLCDRAVELFGADAAGVLVAEPSTSPRLLAVSSDAPEVVGLFLDAYDHAPWTAAPRAAFTARVTGGRDPWSVAAAAAGYAHAVALPMRVRHRHLGVLGLLLRDGHALDAAELDEAQTLAHAAALGLVCNRELREATEAAERLRTRLERATMLERARDMLVAAVGADPDATRAVLEQRAPAAPG